MDILNLREPFSTLSHALGLVLAIPATVILVRKSRGERSKQISLLIFGISLAACYLGSALNHGVTGSELRMEWFNRLDRVGIHLLIAGSYTPLAWNLLRGRWKWGTLGLVWGMNLLGATMILARVHVPFALQTCEYLVLGWGAIFCYFEAMRVTSPQSLRLLLLGGVFYSVGACLNLLHWPEFYPGTVGFHGIFHIWVLLGSLAHFAFMRKTIVPYHADRSTPTLASMVFAPENPSGNGYNLVRPSLSMDDDLDLPHRSASIPFNVLASMKDRVA